MKMYTIKVKNAQSLESLGLGKDSIHANHVYSNFRIVQRGLAFEGGYQGFDHYGDEVIFMPDELDWVKEE